MQGLCAAQGHKNSGDKINLAVLDSTSLYREGFGGGRLVVFCFVFDAVNSNEC